MATSKRRAPRKIVYSVKADVNHFRSLLAETSVGEFDGARKGETWDPPDVYCLRPMKKDGTFWGCFSNSGVFAVKASVFDILATFLDESTELLPLHFPDADLKLVNVVEVIDCLDKKNSKTAKGLPWVIDKYVFHPNRFTYSLFKIPQQNLNAIFCVEGLNDPEFEFKGRVEKERLTGLLFDPVWEE